MTTPREPQDPFTSPSAPLPPQGQQPPMAFPPPTHIAVSQSSAPTTLALWATILTGAVAALGLIGAAMAPGRIEDTKALLEDPESASPFASLNPLDFLGFPLLVASFVVLALWMQRLRSAMTARGEVPGGPPAVEWWGWFVPLAWFVLPFLGMRAITRRKVSTGLLMGWWLPYCAYWAIFWVSYFSSLAAIDYTTGELTNPDILDASVPLGWAASLALAVAWVLLAMIIRQATAAEKALTSDAGGSRF